MKNMKLELEEVLSKELVEQVKLCLVNTNLDDKQKKEIEILILSAFLEGIDN